MVIAQPAAELPGLRSGMDFLAHIEQELRGGRHSLTSWGEATPLALDRRSFFRKNFAIGASSPPLNQAYFAALEKDHALGFVLTYASPADWEAMEPILESIRFR
jgi:hypothetical protein